MFRTYQVLFNRLLLLLDAGIVFLSFALAWFTKFHSGLLKAEGHLPFQSYILVIFSGIVIFLLSNTFTGLYKPMRTQALRAEFLSIIKSAILGLLAFMSILYFVKLVHFSRDVLVLFSALFIVLTLIERLLVRKILRIMRTKGFNQKFILIIGYNAAVNRFLQGLEHHPWFGYRIHGFLSSGDDELTEEIALPCIGTLDELNQVLTSKVVDHVVIALPRSLPKTMAEVTRLCDEQGIQSLILPDYSGLLPARPRFESFAGMPLIDTRYVPLDDALNAFLKRVFDVVFSLLVLIVLLPIFVIIAIAIKLTSKGTVFYVQKRVGKNRRIFNMYKFRSMRVESSVTSGETGWSRPEDPRRTKFGAFLRRMSLDELPQFWNVLIGDMSVIGPRPERPYFVEQFKDEVPRYMVKHRVRPGITGWAQVNGWRGDTSIDMRIQYDIEYIENWYFIWDIKIILRTILSGLVHPNAY